MNVYSNTVLDIIGTTELENLENNLTKLIRETLENSSIRFYWWG